MTDDDWMADVIAEAEPLDAKPEVPYGHWPQRRSCLLACAYMCAAWRNGAGERLGKLFIYFGTQETLDWMTTQAEGILRQFGLFII